MSSQDPNTNTSTITITHQPHPQQQYQQPQQYYQQPPPQQQYYQQPPPQQHQYPPQQQYYPPQDNYTTYAPQPPQYQQQHQYPPQPQYQQEQYQQQQPINYNNPYYDQPQSNHYDYSNLHPTTTPTGASISLSTSSPKPNVSISIPHHPNGSPLHSQSSVVIPNTSSQSLTNIPFPHQQRVNTTSSTFVQDLLISSAVGCLFFLCTYGLEILSREQLQKSNFFRHIPTFNIHEIGQLLSLSTLSTNPIFHNNSNSNPNQQVIPHKDNMNTNGAAAVTCAIEGIVACSYDDIVYTKDGKQPAIITKNKHYELYDTLRCIRKAEIDPKTNKVIRAAEYNYERTTKQIGSTIENSTGDSVCVIDVQDKCYLDAYIRILKRANDKAYDKLLTPKGKQSLFNDNNKSHNNNKNNNNNTSQPTIIINNITNNGNTSPNNNSNDQNNSKPIIDSPTAPNHKEINTELPPTYQQATGDEINTTTTTTTTNEQHDIDHVATDLIANGENGSTITVIDPISGQLSVKPDTNTTSYGGYGNYGQNNTNNSNSNQTTSNSNGDNTTTYGGYNANHTNVDTTSPNNNNNDNDYEIPPFPSPYLKLSKSLLPSHLYKVYQRNTSYLTSNDVNITHNTSVYNATTNITTNTDPNHGSTTTISNTSSSPNPINMSQTDIDSRLDKPKLIGTIDEEDYLSLNTPINIIGDIYINQSDNTLRVTSSYDNYNDTTYQPIIGNRNKNDVIADLESGAVVAHYVSILCGFIGTALMFATPIRYALGQYKD